MSDDDPFASAALEAEAQRRAWARTVTPDELRAEITRRWVADGYDPHDPELRRWQNGEAFMLEASRAQGVAYTPPWELDPSKTGWHVDRSVPKP